MLLSFWRQKYPEKSYPIGTIIGGHLYDGRYDKKNFNI